MRSRIGLHEATNITFERYQNPSLAAAHCNQMSVCRLLRHDRRLYHVVPLLSKPHDDWTIDVFVREDTHRYAAGLGISTTSSVASISAA